MFLRLLFLVGLGLASFEAPVLRGGSTVELCPSDCNVSWLLLLVASAFSSIVAFISSLLLFICFYVGIDGAVSADDELLVALLLFSLGISNRVLLSSSESIKILVPSIMSFLSFKWCPISWEASHFHLAYFISLRSESTVSKWSSNTAWNCGLMCPVFKFNARAIFEVWFLELPR